MRGDPRFACLEGMGRGEIGPGEAWLTIRELLKENAREFADHVYVALQEVAWRLSGSRRAEPEAAGWQAVFGRACTMLELAGEDATSHKVDALAELIARSARFAEMQPLDDVLGRRHVAALLRVLATQGGRAARGAVLEATGLGQANLSRVIAMLEAHGLVRREMSGREADLTLTEVGSAALARLPEGAVPATGPTDLAGVWQATSLGICVTTREGTVIAANPSFEAVVGTSPEVAAAVHLAKDGAHDYQVGEGRWARRIDVELGDDRICSVWLDVSDLRDAELAADMRATTAESRLDLQREENARLKARLAKGEVRIAEAQAEAAAARRRLRIHHSMVDLIRNRVAGRLATMARQFHDVLPRRLSQAGTALDESPRQLVALQTALNSVLEDPTANRGARMARVNGAAILENVLASARALAEGHVTAVVPDWLHKYEVDYDAFAMPLHHLLLLNGDRGVDLDVSREGRNVVVDVTTHPPGSGSGRMPSAPLDKGVVEFLRQAVTDCGGDVRFHSSPTAGDDPLGFTMSVPAKPATRATIRDHARDALA